MSPISADLAPTPAPIPEALHSEAQLFRVLVDSTSDYAIFMLHPDGTVATWNPGAERFKGYRREEILGQHFSCFYPPEDIAAHRPDRELEVAAATGRYEEEGFRCRKNGERFWASVVITALRDSDGKLLGYGKITRDLTERRWAREQFRLALEASPTGMLMAGADSRILLVNAQIERLFGHSREALIGASVDVLIPERFRRWHQAYRKAFFAGKPTPELAPGLELIGLHRDGHEIPVEFGLNPLESPEGRVLLCSISDIAPRKRAEAERERLLGDLKALNLDLEQRIASTAASLKEREVLLQEVHHRVKNNLQVISSLINMQCRQLKDPSSRDALEECQTRVQAIALIHEKLYQSKDYARVPFTQYVRSLAANVFHATGVSPSAVTLELEIDDVALPVDRAIPCGLILNELMTNALKHAFPNGRTGCIRVQLKVLPSDQLLLCVSDDGVGISPSFDVKTASTLGMQLITTLSEQLDGQLEIQSGAITAFRLTMPFQGTWNP